MTIIGLIIALALFHHYRKHLSRSRRLYELDDERMSGSAPMSSGRSWHDEWHRHWADKFHREAERRQRDFERHSKRTAKRWEKETRRQARRFGGGVDAWPSCGGWHGSQDEAERGNDREPQASGAAGGGDTLGGRGPDDLNGHAHTEQSGAGKPGEGRPRDAARHRQAGDPQGQKILRRARRRAAAEVSFYAHLMSYLGVIAFLALINLLTTPFYAWFLWPALGWGLGLFSHWMAVFGSRILRQRYFDPAVEREVRRETIAVRTEKQASIDELSATIAHEIRNPIAAAKSLVQQMGEDPHSFENVEYAQVAIEELDRVEHSISHLLRFAKEEDLHFAPVNLAGVIDSALTELRAKLDAAKVSISRNYITGPTIVADGEKLRQVFANILDNAIDALSPVVEGRRVEVFVENGTPHRAKVRLRDNGAGIATEQIDKIFNPFFTTKEKGTGLGMAISKKIVEAHEGTIDVVSEPGRGTEFIVELPLPH